MSQSYSIVVQGAKNWISYLQAQYGDAIYVTESTIETIDYLKNHIPHVCIIQGVTGIETLLQLEQNHYDTSIIFVIENNDYDLLKRVIELGVDDYVMCDDKGHFFDILRLLVEKNISSARHDRLQRIMQTVDIGILLMSAEGEITLHNENLLKLLDINENTPPRSYDDLSQYFLGENGQPLSADHDPARIALERHRRVDSAVLGVRRAGDEICWLLCNAAPYFNEDGSVRYVVCSFNDITRLRTIQSHTKTQAMINQFFNMILPVFVNEELPDAIEFTLRTIGDYSGVDYANLFLFSDNKQFFTQSYHWNKPEFNRKHSPMTDLQVRDLKVIVNLILEKTAVVYHADDNIDYLPHVFRLMRIKSLMFVPLVDQNTVIGMLGFQSTDVNRKWSGYDEQLLRFVAEAVVMGYDRHRFEQALLVAKEEAENANKQKSLFLANMSHELRTPLNAILGFTQLMSRGNIDDVHLRENIDVINRSGEHLLNLINDILELSRIESGHVTLNPTVFSVQSMLHDIEEMMTIHAQRKNLILTITTASDVPNYIRADQGRIKQVLINLISNGIKYTDQGSIYVICRREGKNRLRFEVKDTGRGIPETYRDHLFDAFIRERSEETIQSGVGLGLPISRSFAQFMGGDVWFMSHEQGKGTTFFFTLEFTRVEESTTTDEFKARRFVTGIKGTERYPTMMIVEDQSDNRLLMQEFLEPIGFKIDAVSDGVAAIERAKQGDIELVLMDIRMPNMDGIEATKRIKALPSPPIVIALTANVLDYPANILLNSGFDDVIYKPFRENDLFDKLAFHLNLDFEYSSDTTNHKAKADQLATHDDTVTEQVIQTAIRRVPREIVEALNVAAAIADYAEVGHQITLLKKYDQALGDLFENMLSSFRFDTIVQLTKT